MHSKQRMADNSGKKTHLLVSSSAWMNVASLRGQILGRRRPCRVPGTLVTCFINLASGKVQPARHSVHRSTAEKWRRLHVAGALNADLCALWQWWLPLIPLRLHSHSLASTLPQLTHSLFSWSYQPESAPSPCHEFLPLTFHVQDKCWEIYSVIHSLQIPKVFYLFFCLWLFCLVFPFSNFAPSDQSELRAKGVCGSLSQLSLERGQGDILDKWPVRRRAT